MLARELPIYRNHEVASLAWAIGSAPLIISGIDHLPILDENWCDEQFEKNRTWLNELDLNPTPLKQWLLQSDDKLLGKRFESMIAFWFSESPFFKILHRNILFTLEKNTIGEADFIVREIATGKFLHIETACKYYLGSHKSAQWKNWLGPNGHDSLLLKMDKLKKQVTIFETQPAKEFLIKNHLNSISSHVLLKGYFFHHFSEMRGPIAPFNAHPHYNSGWYVMQSELSQFESPVTQWLVLPKTYWTCPFHFPVSEIPVLTGSEMLTFVNDKIEQKKKAVMIIQVYRLEDMLHETSRGFVVPNSNVDFTK